MGQPRSQPVVSLAEEVADPRERTAAVEVVGVPLVLVRLLLGGDVAVGFLVVAVDGEAHQPLHEVEHVERGQRRQQPPRRQVGHEHGHGQQRRTHDDYLELLPQVDALVPLVVFEQRTFPRKYQWPDGESRKSRQRDNLVVDDLFHTTKICPHRKIFGTTFGGVGYIS